MFRQAYDLLRPGGMFFAADFVQKGQLTEDEWKVQEEGKREREKERKRKRKRKKRREEKGRREKRKSGREVWGKNE